MSVLSRLLDLRVVIVATAVLGLLDSYLPSQAPPGLEWASFLGAGGREYVSDVQVTSADLVVVAGTTRSNRYPRTGGPSNAGNGDAFVTCFAADGSGLVWSYLLGGSGQDSANAVFFDPATNRVHVAGSTSSATFPTTTGAVQRALGGSSDAFYAILDTSNGSPLYSTLLGGSASDGATDMFVDAQGTATLVGWGDSVNFPTTPSAMRRTPQMTDAFVSRIQVAANGSSILTYSSLVGGPSGEHPRAMSTLAGGRIALAGLAWGGGIVACNGGWQIGFGGGPTDGFAAIVDPSKPASQQLEWATYVGGSADDEVSDLALGPNGELLLTGWSISNDLGLGGNGFQPTRSGVRNGFVLHLDPSRPPASQLLWGSFLGGNSSSDTQIASLGVDAAGIVTVAGWVQGNGLPVTPGALQGGWSGNIDAFVARIDPSLATISQVRYCGYLGTSGFEGADHVALDPHGGIVLAGTTSSSTFPATPGAFNASYGNGPNDVFVALLSMLFQGVSRYGTATTPCGGSTWLATNSRPFGGNAGFAFETHGAPPNAFGALVAGVPLPGGVALLNSQLFLTAPILLPFTTSDALGAATHAIPSGITGLGGLGFQSLWLSPLPCASGPLTASNALR